MIKVLLETLTPQEKLEQYILWSRYKPLDLPMVKSPCYVYQQK